jgi:flagellar biosynthesis/type III secretory pathway chaperone
VVKAVGRGILIRKSFLLAMMLFSTGSKTNMEVQPIISDLTGELITKTEQLSRAEYEQKRTVERVQHLADGTIKIVTTDYFMTTYNAAGKKSVVYSTGQHVNIVV